MEPANPGVGPTQSTSEERSVETTSFGTFSWECGPAPKAPRLPLLSIGSAAYLAL